MRTQLDNKIWLSDRGIVKLLDDGLMKGVDPDNINQFTADVCSSEDVELNSFQRRMVIHDRVEVPDGFSLYGELKSTLRRNFVSGNYCADDQGFILVNPTAQTYSVSKGVKFGQVLVGGRPDGPAIEYEHGRVLTFDTDLKKLLREGLVSSTPGLEIRGGFFVFHASDRGYSIKIDPRKRKEVSEKVYFGNGSHQVELRRPGESGDFKLEWNCGLNVALKERVALSPFVGMQLFYYDSVERRFEPNGIVDPGFEGNLSLFAVPNGSKKIKVDDVIVFARAIHFKNGVENPYGHLKHNYQGAEY